jgi:NhaA family Na+:H+ antiporter
MTKKQSAKKRAPSRPVLPLVLIGVVLVAAIGAGAWYFTQTRRAGSVASGDAGAEPPRALGPETAPVVLEEFGDYQCPSCGQVYPEVEEIRREYGDRLRLIFRHYPLTRIHPHALLAAHAAEAAGLQGKFWEMHRALYEDQQTWSRTRDPRPLFESYARRTGLDVERFRRDVGGAEVDARVVADHRRAQSLGLDSTPTFFLNGRKLPATSGTGRELRAQVERELNK